MKAAICALGLLDDLSSEHEPKHIATARRATAAIIVDFFKILMIYTFLDCRLCKVTFFSENYDFARRIV
jgi:hypothetical protein